jgi:hypothetical protein
MTSSILCSNCDRLDVLVFKVPAAMRQNSKMKVDQLKYDVRHLQVNKSQQKWNINNEITNWLNFNFRRH